VLVLPAAVRLGLDRLRTWVYGLREREGRLAMTVAAILRAKGSHVESSTPETTIFSVVWALKGQGIGAL